MKFDPDLLILAFDGTPIQTPTGKRLRNPKTQELENELKDVTLKGIVSEVLSIEVPEKRREAGDSIKAVSIALRFFDAEHPNLEPGDAQIILDRAETMLAEGFLSPIAHYRLNQIFKPCASGADLLTSGRLPADKGDA